MTLSICAIGLNNLGNSEAAFTDCKSVHTGSIPVVASNKFLNGIKRKLQQKLRFRARDRLGKVCTSRHGHAPR
jgi:hypothetical protein